MTVASDDLAARRVALSLIRRTMEDGAMLEEGAASAGLSPADSARALSLARASMRWRAAAETLIADYVKRTPRGSVQDILVLGVVELLALGQADYGVVDAAVRLAKSDGAAKPAAGMVNAVLRKVAREGPDRWAAMDHARLASPPWLVRQLRGDWGRGAAQAIGAAHLHTPPLDLTLKSGDAAEWAARLGAAITPTGSLRLARPGRISGLPGYDDGDWWAQDAAAALPARLAGPGEGRRALDLCAAPGGKTMQLAAAGWAVTALDASAARLRRLERNLDRTGLKAEVITADAETWDGGLFDLVLLDAPCSATGTIRRHPELPHIRDGSATAELAAAQARLLDAAWARVAPGGTLIYCVCSLAKAEGEDRIAAFRAANEDVRPAPVTVDEIGDEGLIDPLGDLRTRPDFWKDLGGLDGFFAARMHRDA